MIREIGKRESEKGEKVRRKERTRKKNEKKMIAIVET